MYSMSRTAIPLDGESLITSDLIQRASPSAELNAQESVELREAVAQLLVILELARSGFQEGGRTEGVVSRLAGELHLLRRASTAAIWQKLIVAAQTHPVMEFLQQDPLTNWSFTKPRGYTGDAGLLDIYYKHPSMDHLLTDCTPLGRDIYDYTSDVPACAAGRERCEILARFVDETAERTEEPAEILAVAAGHLREAGICRSLPAGRLRRWVALDQDPISVGTMTRDLSGTVVSPMNGSVLGLLRRSYKLGTFDLVYASGLYDYLQEKTAVKLMQRLVELLRPGGMVLFANFSDEITSDGYMETFMDWPLILRSADDMWKIIDAGVDRSAYETEVWYGGNRNIVYSTLRKK
jgi:SAM-dependent methyltransferase